MKRLLLLALFAATAASAKAPAERWLDPECFEVGRAPMRTSFIAFPTAAEAIPENDYTRSPFYRTLTANGPSCAWTDREPNPKGSSAPDTTTRRGAQCPCRESGS